MAKNELNQFAVIGLGRFGTALATTLAEMDKEVLVIDKNEDAVNRLAEIVTHSIVADGSDEQVLQSVGIRNFDVVCVCMGDLEASILITLMCLDRGVKFVFAKAKNKKHQAALQKIGANVVVVPEEMMGKKMASRLINPNYADMTELSANYRILEIEAPEKWWNKSLIQIDTRKNFELSVILIKNANGTDNTNPDGETIVKPKDHILLGGSPEAIEKLTNKLLTID
ncbi:MAG: TrkA family potassium uptake protein [Bacillota bacterium]